MKANDTSGWVRALCGTLLSTWPYTPPTFGGGQAPTLTSDEINDIVAFLCTLTDGYDPTNPAAYNLPAQCPGGTVSTATVH